MIKSIEVYNNLGDRLEFELGAPEKTGLWVKSIKGIGPGKADIHMTDLASSDGGIFNSARSQTRNITMTIGLMPYTDEEGNYHEVEEVRRSTYKVFGKKRPITFIIKTETTSLDKQEKKYVTVTRKFVTYGYVESNEPDIFNKQETMAISIICPDPNWYPYNGSEGVIFSSTEDAFEFPDNFEGDGYENPIDENEYFETSDTSFVPGKVYYEYLTNQYVPTEDLVFDDQKTYYEYEDETVFANLIPIVSKSIDYYGDVTIGLSFAIYILGEVSGLALYKIYDVYTHDELLLDDASIQTITGGPLTSGDEIHICTIVGQKSAILIRDAIEYNIMNALGKNPSWFQLDFGINNFSYNAENGAEFVSLAIEYIEAYEGV